MPMLAQPTLQNWREKKKQGVCHTVALPFTFKSILDNIFFKKIFLNKKEEISKFKYFTVKKI
jgi:hypothetical protein